MVFYIIKTRLSFFLLILGNNNLNYFFRSTFIINFTGIDYETIITIATKYNFFLLAIQLYYLSILSLLIRLTWLITIIIIILYYINFYYILSTYDNYEKTNKLRLFALLLLLYCCFIMLTTVKNSQTLLASLICNALIYQLLY